MNEIALTLQSSPTIAKTESCSNWKPKADETALIVFCYHRVRNLNVVHGLRSQERLRLPAAIASYRLRSQLADGVRMMIDDEPRPRTSSDTRHALTVALVKPGRGACWNQVMNSSRTML